jgi:hypothetical protein
MAAVRRKHTVLLFSVRLTLDEKTEYAKRLAGITDNNAK